MDKRKAPFAVGLVAAGAVAGAVLAGTMTANAASTGTSTPSASGSGSGSASASAAANRFSSTPVRTDEKTVSTDVAATLKAAALKAVPGGTVYRVETDADGATYEAHMRKADGTLVTVKFDASNKVTAVQDGMGAGGPGGGRAPQGAPGGPAPGSATSG